MPKPYRIIVLSDTHGNAHSLYEIVTDRMEEADMFIHLGDGERETDDIRTLFPDLKFCQVRGNCDFASQLPITDIITAAGKKIMLTHGHTFQVKYSLYHLKSSAREQNADIILYGHTHQSYTEYEDGLYIMNPGSPVQPRGGSASYGVIDITDAGIVLNIIPF